MLKKGICVSIGTDGASANNRMTMIDEMYVTALIHKGWRLDPTVVKAEEIITMATTNGAKARLWEDEIGALKPGMKADLIIINPDSAQMLPLHDPSVVDARLEFLQIRFRKLRCKGIRIVYLA